MRGVHRPCTWGVNPRLCVWAGGLRGAPPKLRSQGPVAGLGLGWDLKVGPLGVPVPSPGPLTQERLTQASLSWPSEHRGGRRAG